jgi:predicted component of type VI protein secretion system
MRRLATIAAAAGLAAVLSGATGYAVRAATPVNWHQRTCAAFTAWDRHRTAAGLDTLTADSFRVPWKYLGEDVAGLYRDVRSGKTSRLGDDATWVNQDCGG